MADTDISGLTELVADLTHATTKVAIESRKVVQKGALNIKNDWRRRASGLSHAPLYPASITYDTGFKKGGWEAEVGPDKSRPQGALGNLITYGSANNPPTGDDVLVVGAEAPKFEKAMHDLAGSLL